MGTTFLKITYHICNINLHDHEKTIYFLLLGTSLHIHAQWIGPVGGTLSTNNCVHLNHTAPMGMGGGGSNFVFSVSVDDGFGLVIPSLRINDNNGTLEVGKTMQLTNGAGFVMRRANNTNVLSVAPIGSMRLTTDGFNNSFRGFFVNNGTDDFFSVTQNSMFYGGSFTLKGDLIIKDNADEIQYRLYQDGLIRAREVKVDLSIIPPDYVFDPNYILIPINDLEIFLKKHKHLPNIPSADEMTAKGGVNMGEMQLKLLEKVEELTLYVIQLNTEIECLKRQVAILKQ